MAPSKADWSHAHSIPPGPQDSEERQGMSVPVPMAQKILRVRGGVGALGVTPPLCIQGPKLNLLRSTQLKDLNSPPAWPLSPFL